MIIKGAIFDLDGTLLASMEVWDNIGEKYLTYKGGKVPSNLHEILKPMSLLQASQYFKNEHNICDSKEKIIEDINSLIEKEYYEDIILKDGVISILKDFKRKNIKMCIATASQDYLVKAALIRLGIYEYFCGIVTCGDVGSGKDMPNIYYKAVEILGTDIKDTVVFEDALYAIKTAKNAGFNVVAVYDKSSHEDIDEIKHNSDLYLDTFESWKF